MDYIYLDYGATTPIDERVLKIMNEVAKNNYANSESAHNLGFEAHKVVQDSRNKIAQLLSVSPREIIFTGGGTESDNMAILGVARKRLREDASKKYRIITSSIEHPAVLNACKYLEQYGVEIIYLPVDEFGIVDPDVLSEYVTRNTILISIMHSNNEIGTLEPIEEIGKIAKDHNILLHTDAVQSFGKEKIDIKGLNIDMLSASAHKLHGPKGVGLIYLKNGGRITPMEEWDAEEPNESDYYLEKLMHGGGHEYNWRPATVNVPGIAGFTKAVEIMHEEFDYEYPRLKKIQSNLINWITENIKDTRLNGHPEKRLVNNISIGIKGIQGFEILTELDQLGIEISTGSACVANSTDVSNVLQNLPIDPEYKQGTIRITTGRFTTEENIEKLQNSLRKIISDLRNK